MQDAVVVAVVVEIVRNAVIVVNVVIATNVVDVTRASSRRK
jgi:hypothetical protein